MPAQVEYYDDFGRQYRASILACPEPHLWTTDYEEKGRVYKEIKERIELQEALIDNNFSVGEPVLDVGCGFGRQSYLMAKKRYRLTGTDTSPVFIEIAKEIFSRHGLAGNFFCTAKPSDTTGERFSQILLLDVLEHIAPAKRKSFIEDLLASATAKAVLILSLPHVKKRWRSQLNNRIRKALTQHFEYFRKREEHPYPIPQKAEIINLLADHFRLLEFKSTPLTDYYVFEKR